MASSSLSSRRALIFDCDGVLCDTERDGHRVSFNKAFEAAGVDAVWDVKLYGELLEIGGGKERMAHYFDQVGWPDHLVQEHGGSKKEVLARLHALKTRLFTDVVDSGLLGVRPGVLDAIDAARASGWNLAVCSTSNENAVRRIMEVLLGAERYNAFDVVLAGDVVSKKKPDPAIYNLAAYRLDLNPLQCLVVEDSRIGLLAARGAHMRVVVTRSHYTQHEDFASADLVLDNLAQVSFTNLAALVAS